MKTIALFKRIGEPYDPVQTKDRPWLSHYKREIVSPEESIYNYIKYKYPDVKIRLITRNNLHQKVKDLNEKYDFVFAGFEELTLPFKIFAKKGQINMYEKYLNSFKNIRNLYPKFSFINFIMDKCKYYKFLQDIGINVAPTRCFSISNKTQEYYIRSKLKEKNWNKVFMKPLPGLESTNVFSFNKTNLKSSNFKEAVQRLKYKKYDKIVAQKFMKNFATQEFPELRTFWLNKDYQYTISTTSYGYDWKLINKPVNSYIMKKSILILNELEKKFKQKMLLTRIDWGYDKEMGYFVNEIEYAPGVFTEMFNQGSKSWKLDKRYGDLIYKIVNQK